MAFVLIVQECLKGLKDRSALGSLVQARVREEGAYSDEPWQFLRFHLAVRLIGAWFSRP